MKKRLIQKPRVKHWTLCILLLCLPSMISCIGLWWGMEAEANARTQLADESVVTPPDTPLPMPAPYQLQFAPPQLITVGATGSELAAAMDISTSHLLSASLKCRNLSSDELDRRCTVTESAAVVGMAPGTWFPVAGKSFALLSTGHSADIHTEYPITQFPMAYSHRLNSLKNAQGQDLMEVELTLRVPQTATCLSFDYAFYTADIPPSAFAGVADHNYKYNDTFTAQLNESFLGITTTGSVSTVLAPGNFALSRQGEMISVNTINQVNTALALASPAGTSYPDVFPLLKARTKVESGSVITLNLAIQDLGDSLGNSAVAIDNFTWLSDEESEGCVTGISGDQDSDGLPDHWETHGKYHCPSPDACVKLDLNALGADPSIKDVFVEIDYMAPHQGFDPAPLPASIAAIVDAFARAPVDELAGQSNSYQGIHLHVDYGPSAPLTWAKVATNTQPAHWGEMGRGSEIPASEFLGVFGGCDFDTDADVWAGVQKIKKMHFDDHRVPVFHYGVFAHMFHDCGNLSEISGASSNLAGKYLTHGASDFVVTFGHSHWITAAFPYTDRQAGTFMHELGHNFGLTHNGTPYDTLTHKPNHLSVMNYLFQLSGLVAKKPNLRFDYLRHSLPALDESALDEVAGIMGTHAFSYPIGLGTRYFCNDDLVTVTVAAPIDWNCDGEINTTSTVRADIDDNKANTDDDVLIVESEWDKLVFTGGYLNRQQNLVYSGILLIPISDPLSGETSRLAYYRNIRERSVPNAPLMDEVDPQLPSGP